MKGVAISALIAAMILAGSGAYTSHVKKVSYELGVINNEIEKCLKDEDYTAAAEKTADLETYMGRKRTVLAATGNHEDLDKIEMNISEMAGYIDGMQQTDAISHSKVLSFLFEHLPKNYELKLENIL